MTTHPDELADFEAYWNSLADDPTASATLVLHCKFAAANAWLAARSLPATPVPEVERVYLVCTGETYEGQETYTRHDVRPPPLCDAEVLYTRPAPSTSTQGLTEILAAIRHYAWTFAQQTQGHSTGEDSDAAYEAVKTALASAAQPSQAQVALDDCQQYLKEGETPAECIERNRTDVDSALSLLVKEKQRVEAADIAIRQARRFLLNLNGPNTALANEFNRVLKALGTYEEDHGAHNKREEAAHASIQAQKEHISSAECWCQPEVDCVDPETGATVYVHRGQQ